MLHPVPASLKVHESSVYAMDLLGAKSSNSEPFSPSPMFRMVNEKLNFEKSDIMVEFFSRTSASDVSAAVLSARSKLVAGKHSSLLEMSKFRHPGAKRNMWFEAYSSVSDSSLPLKSSDGHALADVHSECAYSALDFDEIGSLVIVKGLHNIVEGRSGGACFANLVSSLALEPGVESVYVKPHHTVLNDVDKSIVQAKTSASGTHPYADAGLNGTGQIVGVGDTGVDDRHCMFINSDGSRVEKSTTPTTDYTNRKIVQYISYANGADTSGGHGTHVAGTVAGFDESLSLDAEKGHASGAKITVYDNIIFY